MITLTQMRYFYEVCQWQNITKAAEHLHVSQPTISVAMQTLEAETGLNLFHREGRKLVVTPEGSKLLGKVNHILTQMDQLETEIQDMARNRNHIRMALPLQIGTRFLPRILGEFRLPIRRSSSGSSRRAASAPCRWSRMRSSTSP